MNQKERREYWKTHIEAFEKSGLTKLAYSQMHDISRYGLLDWKRKLARFTERNREKTPARKVSPRPSRPAFVVLKSGDSPPVRASTEVRFRLPGGVEFEGANYPDPAWLRAVMGVRE